MPCLGKDKKTPVNIMVKDFQLCSFAVNPPHYLAGFRKNYPDTKAGFLFFCFINVSVADVKSDATKLYILKLQMKITSIRINDLIYLI